MQVRVCQVKKILSGSSSLPGIDVLTNGSFLYKCIFPLQMGKFILFFKAGKGEVKKFSCIFWL